MYYIQAIDWHYSVDDFYEVQSMRGVYITTAVSDTSPTLQRDDTGEPSIPPPAFCLPAILSCSYYSCDYDHIEQWW